MSEPAPGQLWVHAVGTFLVLPKEEAGFWRCLVVESSNHRYPPGRVGMWLLDDRFWRRVA